MELGPSRSQSRSQSSAGWKLRIWVSYETRQQSDGAELAGGRRTIGTSIRPDLVWYFSLSLETGTSKPSLSEPELRLDARASQSRKVSSDICTLPRSTRRKGEKQGMMGGGGGGGDNCNRTRPYPLAVISIMDSRGLNDRNTSPRPRPARSGGLPR